MSHAFVPRFVPALRAAVALALVAPAAPLLAQEKVDVATIEKIKSEAMDRSQVMDIMSWLTDVYGPRLAWSPNLTKAGNWAATTMKSWGLSNVALEPWSTPAGLGWENQRFTFVSTAPNFFQVLSAPRAWSAGTKGKVAGGVVIVPTDTAMTLESFKAKYAGKIKGKFMMLTAPNGLPSQKFTADAVRLTDEQLAQMAAIAPPAPGGGRGGAPGGGRGGFGAGGLRRFNLTTDTFALRFMEQQGVAAVLMLARGSDGTIFTDNGAKRDMKAPQVPMVHVSYESYGRIWRMAEKNVPVQLELEMQNRFIPADSTSFNVIAEIPGTDPALKDEVVMIGGHFDSWHAGTGATDNGAGSATMMEAMRILKALDLKPRRTIRIGLWTAEEEGLMGSRAYVAKHYGARDSTGLHVTPEQAKFAAYFNLDNGSGKIRGVYQQLNTAVAPIFQAWMAPFNAGGMKTLTISTTGGTDHLTFDGVGLPGFQFIQDGLDYGTRTHHTNMDVYEKIQPEDMKWNAAVLAAFAWQAAQRDEKLPRKPAPAPAARPTP
ncbi:MAG: M20/M25/M40 family metallo-hydrolase [Gemmatimonadetes bacterium]|nr:M20/M25/M40 family metallo-hydrolase [Gemmatimonadota bacterium]